MNKVNSVSLALNDFLLSTIYFIGYFLKRNSLGISATKISLGCCTHLMWIFLFFFSPHEWLNRLRKSPPILFQCVFLKTNICSPTGLRYESVSQWLLTSVLTSSIQMSYQLYSSSGPRLASSQIKENKTSPHSLPPSADLHAPKCSCAWKTSQELMKLPADLRFFLQPIASAHTSSSP